MADGTKDGSFSPGRKPATTSEGRENELIVLAEHAAEKMMREGTAPAAVINHYLKLGSSREKLEQDRLRGENHLLKIKAETLAAQAKIEEIYKEAIEAMRSYSPSNAPAPDDVEFITDEFDDE